MSALNDASTRPLGQDLAAVRVDPRRNSWQSHGIAVKQDRVFPLILRRLGNPRHIAESIRRALRRDAPRTARNNSQLVLYSKILETDFLHYGCFAPGTHPETLSLRDLGEAQQRYSERILGFVKASPVLDVGAGLGGITRLLLDRDCIPVALTPDRAQVDYIRTRFPTVELIPHRFQDVDWSAHAGRFGSVITAESLQYFALDRAFDIMSSILAGGGRWIACDYFRRNDSAVEASGHLWSEFQALASSSGWRTIHEEDITEEITPGLAYIAMIGRRLVHPVYRFLEARLERKHPAVHYLLEDALRLQDRRYERGLAIIDPERFRREKRYMLVVLEKA